MALFYAVQCGFNFKVKCVDKILKCKIQIKAIQQYFPVALYIMLYINYALYIMLYINYALYIMLYINYALYIMLYINALYLCCRRWF